MPPRKKRRTSATASASATSEERPQGSARGRSKENSDKQQGSTRKSSKSTKRGEDEAVSAARSSLGLANLPGSLKKEDIMCPICWSIFIEPVTIPCNHTFCKDCFLKHVDQTSLQCPCCRRRLGTFSRKGIKEGNIVDKALWDRIKREFPRLVETRLMGLDSQQLSQDAYVSTLESSSTSVVQHNEGSTSTSTAMLNPGADNSVDLALLAECEVVLGTPVIRDGQMDLPQGEMRKELEDIMKKHREEEELRRKLEEDESERVARELEEENRRRREEEMERLRREEEKGETLARELEEENRRHQEELQRRRREEEEASQKILLEWGVISNLSESQSTESQDLEPNSDPLNIGFERENGSRTSTSNTAFPPILSPNTLRMLDNEDNEPVPSTSANLSLLNTVQQTPFDSPNSISSLANECLSQSLGVTLPILPYSFECVDNENNTNCEPGTSTSSSTNLETNNTELSNPTDAEPLPGPSRDLYKDHRSPLQNIYPIDPGASQRLMEAENSQNMDDLEIEDRSPLPFFPPSPSEESPIPIDDEFLESQKVAFEEIENKQRQEEEDRKIALKIQRDFDRHKFVREDKIQTRRREVRILPTRNIRQPRRSTKR